MDYILAFTLVLLFKNFFLKIIIINSYFFHNISKNLNSKREKKQEITISYIDQKVNIRKEKYLTFKI